MFRYHELALLLPGCSGVAIHTCKRVHTGYNKIKNIEIDLDASRLL